MANVLSLRFAHEEFVYLLRALQIEAIGGLTRESLAHLSANEQALVMSVADRTLRARGVVHWRDADDRFVEQLVTEVFLACSRAQYALTAETAGDKTSPRSAYYLFAPHVAEAVVSPEPGVYEFVTIARDSIQEWLRSLTPFSVAHDPFQAHATTSRASFTQAVECVSAGAKAVQEILVTALPPAMARSLALALTQPKGTVTLTLQSLNPDLIPTYGVTTLQALQGLDALWLIENQNDSATASQEITVRSATTNSLMQRIEMLLAPALELFTALT